MITFNVGPSKIYPQVQQYLQDAYNQNVLSISHRSSDFDAFSKKCLQLLHEKLEIPAEYTILYTGSATESWEIISQDVVNAKAVHFFNGEFGKKWFEYAKFIIPQTIGYKFDENEAIQLSDYQIDSDNEMLAFTLNETSTGTQVKENIIDEAKVKFPNALIAIDTTSCIGGININFSKYDIVFGSVQKCFGLPAGLGLLILSPKSLAKAEEKAIKGRYNSLLKMAEYIKLFQTSFTPNVLAIYLLSRVLETIEPISITNKTIKNQAKEWYDFIPKIAGFHLHISNAEVQSDTVITVGSTEENVSKIKKAAKAAGLELGSGYGPLKNSTFRIANFPAITTAEIQILKEFLSTI
ncbi:MAG: aminotransferase class V-fold PLP-dependent enzyme [Cytophagales bacterium]